MNLKRKLNLAKFAVLEKLLTTPKLAELHLLNPFIGRIIPFNKPHAFNIKKLEEHDIEIHLPLIKNNRNHLGTMHACAMATLGELSSGLLLVKHFSPANYRLIMKELNASYTYQAKTPVYSKCTLTQESIKQVLEDLSRDELTIVPLNTQIFDTDDKLVCEVKTDWQLKNWEYVKTL